MKLAAFDGDNTLWEPLDGVNLSDCTPTDALGRPDFAYAPTAHSYIVVRDDGARFSLRPEARETLNELKRRGVLLGVVSYNHAGNVRRILDAFGVLPCFDFIVAEWHTDKDKMLRKMLAMARAAGHSLRASDLILVDDDPYEIYRGQCERMGACFSCFGTDIHDLRQVLSLVDTPWGESSDSANSQP